ncbi:MAG: hypothetical protein INR73_00575 [Williamsia sp.]|nr:hypothetical protein [Williamsia sp.]
MQERYRYTSAIDYISGLQFDFMETYSFCRGKEYESSLEMLSAEYEQLKTSKHGRENAGSQEDQRYKELTRLLADTHYLVDKAGNFHFSSNKINTFRHDDTQVHAFRQILETDTRDELKLLCAPEYRDALVFYDQSGKIVSTLNVCLSCLYMETEAFNYINAGYETYDRLKRWFIANGHQVENPDYLFTDEVNKLIGKHRKASSP